MRIERLAIGDVLLIAPDVFRDERGSFSEVWNARWFADAGIDVHFVQDNHAVSAKTGTVRGLHFQLPPHGQDKLVRVVKGAVLDVAVDVRSGSPTFGRHVSARLTAENGLQMWVPKGFAHGYVTLEPDTHVVYKVTDYYAPSHDRGIQWDDPSLGIAWGVTRDAAILSSKDAALPPLAALPPMFE